MRPALACLRHAAARPFPARTLLILDLDETLIYATETALDRPADFSVYGYHVYRRPHLDAFLATCANYGDSALNPSDLR